VQPCEMIRARINDREDGSAGGYDASGPEAGGLYKLDDS
jgi:hypothetical protein